MKPKRSLKPQAPCHCSAYPFPHRLGSGKCDNTSLDGPYCGECGKSCKVIAEDFGIGSYEYWGSKGVDVDVQVVSECCHETAYHDANHHRHYTLSELQGACDDH